MSKMQFKKVVQNELWEETLCARPVYAFQVSEQTIKPAETFFEIRG